MNRSVYHTLARQSLDGVELEDALCERILTDRRLELLPLLDAAYTVRRAHHGHAVMIHVLNNVRNGFCGENCTYCAQGRESEAAIDLYGSKGRDEILAEAERALRAGASRYCLVYSGRQASTTRIEELCAIIPEIKARFPLEVCVSTGFIDEQGARALKRAGLDRLNHNLNTCEERYPQVCTSHTYRDRLTTLHAAQQAGLGICSGMIVGMGESAAEVVEVAKTLRALQVHSVPVNFLVPIEGNALTQAQVLTPQYCLRVLVLFRLLHPQADVRAAAGREYHLRSMEPLCLYPANSLFLDGYLNVTGAESQRVYQMIQDAGFTVAGEMTQSKEMPTPTMATLKDRMALRPAEGTVNCEP